MISAVVIGYVFMVCSGFTVIFLTSASWNYAHAMDYQEANCTGLGNFSINCLGPMCTCYMVGNYTVTGNYTGTSTASTYGGTVTLKNPYVTPLGMTTTQCHRWRDALLEQAPVPCHVKELAEHTVGYTILNIVPLYITFAVGLTLLFVGLITAGIYHSRGRSRPMSHNYMLIQAGA